MWVGPIFCSHVGFWWIQTLRFIEILGNCPCLCYMSSNTTLNRLGFGMLTVGTDVFDCICWLVPVAIDGHVSLYSVEYLESVEEYSESKIGKSEPELRNGNINTVYVIHQARWKTRISGTKFVYDEQARDCKYFLIIIRIAFIKIYFHKLAFTLKHYE